MYRFRDRYARKWNLNLVAIQNKPAIESGVGPKSGSKLECCTQLKTQALKDFLKKTKMDAILLAIRRDEHGIRAKERVFSPRDEDFNWRYQEQQPELWDLFKTSAKGTNHLRVHPMLHWKEIDIWRYTEREKIPIVGLYLSRNGKRYRSLGCACCCAPIESKAKNIAEIITELESTVISERSGRAQDKEDAYTMQKLRSLGYM